MNEYKKKLAAMQAGQVNKESDKPQMTNGIPKVTKATVTGWGFLESYTETDPVFASWLATDPLSGYALSSNTYTKDDVDDLNRTIYEDMDAWDDSVFEALPEWVQEKIKNTVQNMTGLNVTGVNIRIANVEVER